MKRLWLLAIVLFGGCEESNNPVRVSENRRIICEITLHEHIAVGGWGGYESWNVGMVSTKNRNRAFMFDDKWLYVKVEKGDFVTILVTPYGSYVGGSLRVTEEESLPVEEK